MRVKPDDLLGALKVADLIPKGDRKKNYRTVYHRLEAGDNCLVIKTTDGQALTEWRVPTEGDLPQLGVNVERARLSQVRHLLGGGAVSLEQDETNKILILKRDQTLQIAVPYKELSAIYHVPADSKDTVTWKFNRDVLAKVLGFAHPFILETGNAPHTCATLYANGMLMTGDPQKLVLVQGVSMQRGEDTSTAYVSFKAAGAKIAAGFLRHVGPEVELTFSTAGVGLTVLRDPESGNTLVLPNVEARFGMEPEPWLTYEWRETSLVDIGYLLSTARTFSGVASPNVAPGLVLEFGGSGQHASLTVRTNEQEVARRCSREFGVYRDISDQQAAKATVIRVAANLLEQALRSMEGVTVSVDIGRRMLKISPCKSEEESGQVFYEEPGVVYSILLTADTPFAKKEEPEISVEHRDPVPVQKPVGDKT